MGKINQKENLITIDEVLNDNENSLIKERFSQLNVKGSIFLVEEFPPFFKEVLALKKDVDEHLNFFKKRLSSSKTRDSIEETCCKFYCYHALHEFIKSHKYSNYRKYKNIRYSDLYSFYKASTSCPGIYNIIKNCIKFQLLALSDNLNIFLDEEITIIVGLNVAFNRLKGFTIYEEDRHKSIKDLKYNALVSAWSIERVLDAAIDAENEIISRNYKLDLIKK